jgi:hypothetical protein
MKQPFVLNELRTEKQYIVIDVSGKLNVLSFYQFHVEGKKPQSYLLVHLPEHISWQHRS